MDKQIMIIFVLCYLIMFNIIMIKIIQKQLLFQIVILQHKIQR